MNQLNEGEKNSDSTWLDDDLSDEALDAMTSAFCIATGIRKPD